jgi:hypothetical protein
VIRPRAAAGTKKERAEKEKKRRTREEKTSHIVLWPYIKSSPVHSHVTIWLHVGGLWERGVGIKLLGGPYEGM